MFFNSIVRYAASLIFLSFSFLRFLDYNYIEFCLASPSYKSLCMSSVIVYPEYRDACESVAAIKAFLLDTHKGPV